jgi:hypothetical protein
MLKGREKKQKNSENQGAGEMSKPARSKGQVKGRNSKIPRTG